MPLKLSFNLIVYREVWIVTGEQNLSVSWINYIGLYVIQG
jgi:hypothetical protein